jgi:hypothetical protein
LKSRYGPDPEDERKKPGLNRKAQIVEYFGGGIDSSAKRQEYVFAQKKLKNAICS